MRAFKRLAAVTAIAGLLAGGTAASASAATQPLTRVHLTGGTTTVTTSSAIAETLLKNDIVPIAIAPGQEALTLGKGGPAVQFTFPVTGGHLNPSPLGGKINHAGGILFLDLSTGKQIEVSAFVISLVQHNLTGIVNGNPKERAPLFHLNLSHAKVTAGKHSASATNIAVTLTATAASALTPRWAPACSPPASPWAPRRPPCASDPAHPPDWPGRPNPFRPAGSAGSSVGSLATVTDEIADGVAALQEATRMLTGVALRSVDVLQGAVSLSQFRVLAVLADFGRARSVQVAAALGLEPSTITRQVDRLVAAGHVTRVTDPRNRSAVILELTASGHRLVAEVAAWRQAELRRILLHLDRADRAALTVTVQRLVQAAGEGYGTMPRGSVPL